MLKHFFILFVLISCVDQSSAQVGGWYPVFLKTTDTQQLNNILDKLKHGGCAKISYPNEQRELAEKIQIFFRDNRFQLDSKESDCHEDNNLKCNHTDVVVTVWSKYNDSQCKIKKI
jgi:hypothetical protein